MDIILYALLLWVFITGVALVVIGAERITLNWVLYGMSGVNWGVYILITILTMLLGLWLL